MPRTGNNSIGHCGVDRSVRRAANVGRSKGELVACRRGRRNCEVYGSRDLVLGIGSQICRPRVALRDETGLQVDKTERGESERFGGSAVRVCHVEANDKTELAADFTGRAIAAIEVGFPLPVGRRLSRVLQVVVGAGKRSYAQRQQNENRKLLHKNARPSLKKVPSEDREMQAAPSMDALALASGFRLNDVQTLAAAATLTASSGGSSI